MAYFDNAATTYPKPENVYSFSEGDETQKIGSLM